MGSLASAPPPSPSSSESSPNARASARRCLLLLISGGGPVGGAFDCFLLKPNESFPLEPCSLLLPPSTVSKCWTPLETQLRVNEYRLCRYCYLVLKLSDATLIFIVINYHPINEEGLFSWFFHPISMFYIITRMRERWEPGHFAGWDRPGYEAEAGLPEGGHPAVRKF